jgi:hypothetical protein
MSVYLLDTNIWLRAVQRESPHHALAVDSLAALLARGDEIVVVAPAAELTEERFPPGVTPWERGRPARVASLRARCPRSRGNVNTYACVSSIKGV